MVFPHLLHINPKIAYQLNMVHTTNNIHGLKIEGTDPYLYNYTQQYSHSCGTTLIFLKPTLHSQIFCV